MLKRLAKSAIKKSAIKNALSPILGLVFVKALEFLNFFYYAIFGSAILKLLFLKTGFWLLCHFKNHFKKYFKFCKLFYY
ncbi:hypothetical protein HPHPP25C_1031 [Helicobacter pylori Hp P-25c]|nr:hypothetical protein HPHPP25C_1031 [Helicobacter pylori Hp P-25c]EJC36743.1 hypothetical protein HPHPP25D_1218 [Helicobacter pylori Hp P-25d]